MVSLCAKTALRALAHRVDRGVGAERPVVGQHQVPHIGGAREIDRVVDRGVPVEVGDRALGGRERRTVHEHVDTLGQRRRRAPDSRRIASGPLGP